MIVPGQTSKSFSSRQLSLSFGQGLICLHENIVVVVTSTKKGGMTKNRFIHHFSFLFISQILLTCLMRAAY